MVELGPPCWTDGLVCPALDGLVDPVQQARELLSSSAAAVASAGSAAGGGAVSAGLVDQVFAIVQLALDDRPPPPLRAAAGAHGRATSNSPGDEKAFRSALSPGALALVPKLTAALQPREGDGERGGAEKGGGGLRGAVVLAARHLTAMEQLVARQNNTPALLMAHNGLAKLLKNSWPWLLGGVVDAPRLLSRLCEIYHDGLDQLNVALAKADAELAASTAVSNGVGDKAPGGAGAAHLKKFGKLLATFGTRMACLLRHLGPECSPQERRKAYRLYAKAAGAVYPGLLASLRARDNVDAGTPSGGVAAEIIYPKAIEAFLSTTDRPPCCQTAAGVGRISPAAAVPKANGGRGAAAPPPPVSCRCYETGEAGEGRSGRSHDPSEALEALRPASRPPPQQTRNGTDTGSAGTGGVGDDGEGPPASAAAAAAAATAVDPLGAVLLLCEFLRGEERASAAAAMGPGLRRECCGWVLDHLAALCPGWVETASAPADAGFDAGASEEELPAALCDEVSTALGSFVSRRALGGEFREAQMQLIEGCACHPHPVCREVWTGALRVFLRRCDPTAQEICTQSLTEAALDPRVSRRCRRRLARALSAAWSVLTPAARAALFKCCRSRLQEGGGGGACALDLLRSLPVWRSCSAAGGGGGGGGGGGDELAAASVAFARSAVTSGLRSVPVDLSAGGGGGRGGGRRGDANRRQAEETLAAAVMFLAARADDPGLGDVGGGDGGGGGERRGNGRKNEFWAHAGVEEVAREAGEKLGSALSAGHSDHTLAAIARLLSKTNPSRLPQLCALLVARAGEGKLGGGALLVLSEALARVGLLKHGDTNDWKTVLEDGFTALFRCRLWPVTTAAMQAIEAVARCANPGIDGLLPRLVPNSLLAMFRAWVARCMVYSDGGRPLELEVVRERGLAEMRVLAAAAAAALVEGRSGSGASAGTSREVVLREGGDLSGLAGLLTCSVVGMRLLSEEEGGGVCLALRE